MVFHMLISGISFFIDCNMLINITVGRFNRCPHLQWLPDVNININVLKSNFELQSKLYLLSKILIFCLDVYIVRI